MSAGIYNLTLEQGTTFQRVLTWLDGDSSPIDLSTYTARMQLRQTVAAPDPPSLLLTTENGRITLGGAAGTITLLVSATDTALLPARVYVYDLEMVQADGTVLRLVKGSITVDPEVTR